MNCKSNHGSPSKLRQVQLSNFNRVKVLGVGSFGRVELVQDKRDPTLMYALKLQQKQNIMTSQQLDNCLRERRLLEGKCATRRFLQKRRLQLLLEYFFFFISSSFSFLLSVVLL